jgi:hypothetical protein
MKSPNNGKSWTIPERIMSKKRAMFQIRDQGLKMGDSSLGLVEPSAEFVGLLRFYRVTVKLNWLFLAVTRTIV